jgi:hypothetical protein
MQITNGRDSYGQGSSGSRRSFSVCVQDSRNRSSTVRLSRSQCCSIHQNTISVCLYRWRGVPNEPLGLAKNLVDTIDDHQNVDSRFYLFFSPDARDSTAAAGFSANGANYKSVLQQLLGAVFQQSRFHDCPTERVALLRGLACDRNSEAIINRVQ